jgi:hypothetical protein
MARVRNIVFEAMAAGVLLAGCHSQEITGPRASGADIKTAFVGNTMHAKSVDGDYVAYFAADGSSRVNAGVTSDTGTYRIADDMVCITWTHLRAGAEHCYVVFKKGDTYTMQQPNGVVWSDATFTPGNSLGL